MFYNFSLCYWSFFPHKYSHFYSLWITKMFDTVSRAGICKQTQKLCYILIFLKAILYSASFTSGSFFVSNKINYNNVSLDYFKTISDYYWFCCSVAQLCPTVQPRGLQHTRPLCPSPSPEVRPSSCPLHWWYDPAISSSDSPILPLPSIFLSIRDFSSEPSVYIRWPKYWNFSISTSPSNEYSGLISLKIDWFDLLAVKGLWAVPTPQFKGIHSSALCLPYSPALTTAHDHWEDHSLDYIDLRWQSNVSAVHHTVYVCYSLPAKKQLSSDFMAAVTIHNDLGAQENEICHYLNLFSLNLSWSNGTRCHDLSFFFFNSFKLALSFSSFTLNKRAFSSSLLSAIRAVSSANLRSLMFLLPITLIPAYNFSSPAFLKMC